MTTEKRRDSRYAARWPTRLVLQSRNVAMLTDDVSFHGLFLETPIELNLGELARLTVVPFDGEAIGLHVVPVRLLPTGSGWFGVGARLLVVPERWEHVLSTLRDASFGAIRVHRSAADEAASVSAKS
jgi:hypothetical protein